MAHAQQREGVNYLSLCLLVTWILTGWFIQG